MEKSPANKFFTSKFAIIGLGVIILAAVFLIILDTSGTKKLPQPTPTPSPKSGVIPPIAPDKQIQGKILVKFKAEYTDEQINEHLKEYNASIISKISGINYTAVQVPNGQENAILEKMKTDPYVEKAQGDYSTHVMFAPNDPLYNQQWAFKNTGQPIKGVAGTAGVDIGAEAAWDVTKGDGIKVAILDTGINVSHPDFAGKIVAKKDFSNSPSGIEDNYGHGTHVAGIVGAATNNTAEVAGTCPNCQLIIGKVLGDDGSGDSNNSITAITWAADQGAKVINMSLGGTNPGATQAYIDAIKYATQKGTIVVASAGNCGGSNFKANGCTSQNQTSYPGGIAGVVSVAATNNTDALASFSNHGSYVRVAAPGGSILSTAPNHNFKLQNGDTSILSHMYLSGTSMSAPVVSGTLALIWATSYGTSTTNVINRLYSTADKISGTGANWTEGRINLAKAVGAGVSPSGPSYPSPTYVCAGSPVGGVCPPTPTLSSSTGGGISISPISGVPSGVLSGVPSGGGGSSSGGGTSGGSGSGGGGTGIPCPRVNQVVYSKAYTYATGSKSARTIRAQDGFLSGFFDFLFQLLQILFQLLGIGNPCLIIPPGGGGTSSTSGGGGSTSGGISQTPISGVPTISLVPTLGGGTTSGGGGTTSGGGGGGTTTGGGGTTTGGGGTTTGGGVSGTPSGGPGGGGTTTGGGSTGGGSNGSTGGGSNGSTGGGNGSSGGGSCPGAGNAIDQPTCDTQCGGQGYAWCQGEPRGCNPAGTACKACGPIDPNNPNVFCAAKQQFIPPNGQRPTCGGDQGAGRTPGICKPCPGNAVGTTNPDPSNGATTCDCGPNTISATGKNCVPPVTGCVPNDGGGQTDTPNKCNKCMPGLINSPGGQCVPPILYCTNPAGYADTPGLCNKCDNQITDPNANTGSGIIHTTDNTCIPNIQYCALTGYNSLLHTGPVCGNSTYCAEGSCTTCIPDYTPASDSNGQKCVKILPHCPLNNVNSAGTCNVCDAGYLRVNGLAPDDPRQCVPRIDHCPDNQHSIIGISPDGKQGRGTCFQCDTGFVTIKHQSECVPQIPNCIIQNQLNGSCKQCDGQSKLINGVCNPI